VAVSGQDGMGATSNAEIGLTVDHYIAMSDGRNSLTNEQEVKII